MIGLGTYAFFWQHSDRVPEPLVASSARSRRTHGSASTSSRSATTPRSTSMDDAELDRRRSRRPRPRAHDRARHEGHRARAPRPLPRARRASSTPGSFAACSTPPTPARRSPRPPSGCAQPAARSRQPASTLALETYEQVATADLVGLVERIDSPRLGICLDPANVVARLELPRDCVEAAPPPHVRTSTSRTSRSPASPAGWASPTAARRWARACTTTRTCSRPCAPATARHQRDRRALAALAGRPRDHRPHRAGLDPHNHRISEEHDMSTTRPTLRRAQAPTGSPSSAPAARWGCASPTTSSRPTTRSPTSRTRPPASSARSTRVAS